MWTSAKETLEDLIKYLTSTQTLYQRKGQIKIKRLQQMTEVLLHRIFNVHYYKILFCFINLYNHLYINIETKLIRIIVLFCVLIISH